jgi:hypothetical protein
MFGGRRSGRPWHKNASNRQRRRKRREEGDGEFASVGVFTKR